MTRSIDDCIFDFAYVMAMRDATLQQAFPVKNKRLLWQEHDDTKEEKLLSQLRNEIKHLLNEYVESIFSDSAQDFYCAAKKVQEAVDEFIAKAKKISNGMPDDAPGFTFGNTQKLINMTAKYMYMSLYKSDKQDDLRKNFSVCHCPMDSIMLEKVAEAAFEEEDAPLKNFREKCCKPRAKNKIKDDVKWSKLDWKEGEAGPSVPEEYRLFQEAIEELVNRDARVSCPLEYDFIAWNPFFENEE